MLYFTHLAPSKCVQNNIVYRGDTPLFSHINVYLVSPCILAAELQSQPGDVSSLPKCFFVELSLEMLFLLVSVPFILFCLSL